MKTIEKLKETNNVEAVLQVKRNQKKLLAHCVDLSQTTRPHARATTTEKRKRNRREKRTITVFHKNDYDLGDTWNDSIQTVIRVERKTQTFNTTTKRFEKSEETAFYVATTNRYSAEEFGIIIRSHWGIENANHYVRDVSLREDFSRIRTNPENVATLRSFALNLLRINHETNISQALYKNVLNIQRILNYVGVRR